MADYTFENGSIVELTAMSDSGHSFTGWGGDLAGTQNPIQLIMDAGKSVVALFTQDAPPPPPPNTDRILTVTVQGQGSVMVNQITVPPPPPGSGNTYFVDYANGSDSNDGLSQSSPLKTCPANLQPGDTVEFKGGVEYKGTVNLSGGSENELITYKGSSNWGNGKAIFELEDTRSRAFTGSKNYVKIENIEFLHWTGGGGGLVKIGSHSIVNNCGFGYIKGWRTSRVKGEPFHLRNVRDVYITNCEFWAIGYYGIKMYDVDGVYILNNNLGGLNRGADAGYFSTIITMKNASKNVHIEDNIIHDGWQYGGDQNPELAHSPNWIHVYGENSSLFPSELYIERNFFYNDHQFRTGTGTGMMSLSGWLNGCYVRDNIIVNSCQWSGGSIFLESFSNNIQIENNTFVSRRYSNSGGVWDITAGNTSTNVKIINNTFFNDDEHPSSDNIRLFQGSLNGMVDGNRWYAKSGRFINRSIDTNSTFDNRGSGMFVNLPNSPANSSQGNYDLR